jgi:quercetin dioxygenase-like cupin family protein
MKHTELEGLEKTTGEAFLNLPEVNIHTPDGLFIKTFAVPANVLVPQHAHEFAHVTLVCKGRVIAWKGRSGIGEFKEGECINIEAGAIHEFLALEDSRLACIHNAEQYDKLTQMNGFEVK